MSAFQCTDRHIATIATAYAALVPGVSAQALANELKRLNTESVNYRYREHTPIEPCHLGDAVADLSPPDLVALCNCLDYQSCEPADYDATLLENIKARFAQDVRHGIKSPVWSI